MGFVLDGNLKYLPVDIRTGKPEEEMMKTHTETFTELEAEALHGKPEAFVAEVMALAKRRTLLDAITLADTDQTEKTRQLKDRAAGGHRLALQGGTKKGGRPKTSPAETEYREHMEAEDLKDAVARKQIEAWVESIERRFEDGYLKRVKQPETATRQVNCNTRGMEHLTKALNEFGKAELWENRYVAIAKDIAEFYAVGELPLVHIDTPGLKSMIQRLKTQYDSELSRLNLDPEEVAAEKMESRRLYDYRQSLQQAAARFRKSDLGRDMWKRYRSEMLAYCEERDQAAVDDEPAQGFLVGARKNLKRILDSFYLTACEVEGMEVDKTAFPQITA